MDGIAEAPRLLGLGLAIIAMVVGFGLVAANAYQWLLRQIREPWRRLLHKADYDESVGVIERSEPVPALEEAWRLYARTRVYAGRPARRFRVAVALVDRTLGRALAATGRWQDALAHFLPAVTVLRGERRMQRALADLLLDAAQANAALEDLDSALELVDEALVLVRRLGPVRWRIPGYHHALYQRIDCLHGLRRFDEAIRMSAEVLSAARDAHDDDALIGNLLVRHARAVSDSGRPQDAIEAAATGLDRIRRTGDPGGLHLAAETLGQALLLAGRYDEAATALFEASELSDAWPDNGHEADRATAVLDRIIYADALNKAGRTEEAIQALQRAEPAVADEAAHFSSRQNRAMYAVVRAGILAQQGKTDEALAVAQVAEERLAVVDAMRPGGWFATDYAALAGLRQRIEAAGQEH